jgi:ribonucleoside-diphosphate reductase alpha chain
MTTLPTQYQQFIHLSRYSRWSYDNKRRETWEETVDRYFTFFKEHLSDNYNYKFRDDDILDLREAVLNLEIMPSMRCLMTAGPALKKENVAGYNCSYVHVDSLRSFDEILYVLMNGTGVGFSVERKHIEKLPPLPHEFHDTDTTIMVSDSKLGWAKAFKELVSLMWSGLIPKWDLSNIRPAGSILKTFGGRASGPEPLDSLFRFVVDLAKLASGRQLKPIECHDIVCKVAEIVVVGGVRRSALLSLSDIDDDEMRYAKSGEWWRDNPQRALANNSANYHETPQTGTFLREWTSLYESKSGERGIFSSKASASQAKRSSDRLVQQETHTFGTNPCSEIILRSREFCNLSEVVIRSSDKMTDIGRKVRLATMLGTIQSTLTNFKYLTREWTKNCEEERLLGVSLTGIMDNKLTANPKPNELESLRSIAIQTNIALAEEIGINPSASITCVKPSGTVSQLVDSASGIHSRHSPYYIRRVRMDAKDPLTSYMQDLEWAWEPDVTKPNDTVVFSFPIQSPKGCITRNDRSAISQLETWKVYQEHWCQHKPSITITVKEEEWLDVGAWVLRNFDIMSGVSFLPHSDHIYKQAPYEDCSKKEYRELGHMICDAHWDDLSQYEQEDYTISSQELACVAGVCEI